MLKLVFLLSLASSMAWAVSSRLSSNCDQWIGDSSQMKGMAAMVLKLAPTKANVLIEGESGSGKEVIARALHEAGPRRDKPFVPVNCPAISRELFESAFFGQVSGAFTDATALRGGYFERAAGGTLFLDKIDELPLDLQAKLLYVIEAKEARPVGGIKSRKFDVRIVVATDQNLLKKVQEGKFRKDLYYRLAVISLPIEPLRNRMIDIPFFAEKFLAKYSKEMGLEVKGLTPEAMRLLEGYSWPGNIRELENVVQRAIFLAPSYGPDVLIEKESIVLKF